MAQSIEARNTSEVMRSTAIPDTIRRAQHWLHTPLARADWLALLILLGGCWLALRPYLFTHDGRLYAFQALAGAYPALNVDPSLSHFNQGSLSLFTPVYSALVGQFGLWPAAWLIYIPTQITYYVALVALITWLVPNRRLAVFTLAVVVGSAGTYPPGIFRFSESFVSARLVAEALVLCGLVAACRQRWWLCLAFLVAATTMHPLMAIAGWAVLGWWLCCHWFGNRRALQLTLGGIGLTAIVLVSLLPPMAPTWRAIVVARSEFLFMSHWPASQWAVMTSTALIGWLGLRREEPRLRRLSEAVLLLLLAAVVFSLLAEWHSASWMLALQPWRVLWLVTIGELILVVSLLSQPAQHDRELTIQAALLAGLALSTAWTPLLFAIIPVAIHQAHRVRIPRFWHYAALFFLALAALMIALSPLVGISIGQRVLGMVTGIDFSPMELLPKLRSYFLLPAVLLTVLLLLHRRWTHPLVIAPSTAFLVLVGAALFDRGDNHLSVMDRQTVGALQQRIAPTEQVYWPLGVRHVWFDLHRPSYASRWQGAPGVFSEALALDVNDRLLRLVAAGFEPAHESIYGADHIAPKSPASIDHACADPRLAWLILPMQTRWHQPADAWNFRHHGEPLTLISCKSVRSGADKRRSP